jgi:pimeloyl-ACP methyl ester carboxylesterase
MTMRTLLILPAVAAVLIMPVRADDSDRLLTIDHYVQVRSTVPAIAGQPAQLYVRERVLAGRALRGTIPPDRVVLFVHGAGTPAEVAFDVPHEDYSWMAYLARAGYDVFSVDMTGYGRSTRPAPMNDPCNLAPERQQGFVAATCAASYSQAMTTIESDWHDIGAAVEYVRQLRGVERVSMIAWSLGGPRAGGYALRNPRHVHRLVLLAPAYNRGSAAGPPAAPAEGVAFNTQSRAEFDANWERQIGCAGQVDPAVADVVWGEMLASDPVGATWGPGVRRAPQTATWGWNAAAVARTETPTLMIAPVHDRQVNPERVRELHADLGASGKVLLDLGCASHNAMWETNRLLLFRASLEWIEKGSVNGEQGGIVRLGYPETPASPSAQPD